MTIFREIWCCGCSSEVKARLTNGAEIYPHRADLIEQPFWRCDACSNYVGTHFKTDRPTEPLGNIPTPELRNARKHIHGMLNPIWEDGRIARREVYYRISKRLGYRFHTAEIKSIEEACNVYRAVLVVSKELG